MYHFKINTIIYNKYSNVLLYRLREILFSLFNYLFMCYNYYGDSMCYYLDKEYTDIVRDILNNNTFLELKKYKHHGDNRYEHCIRVSYYSYKLAKKLHLNKKACARAGLLHDFFLVNNQELSFVKRVKVLFMHPKYAYINSCKYFTINKLEKNIILSHMFPIGIYVPIYFESIMVDLIDDYMSIYERIMQIITILNLHLKKG